MWGSKAAIYTFVKSQAFCKCSLKRHLVNEISHVKVHSSQISMGSLDIIWMLHLKSLSINKKQITLEGGQIVWTRKRTLSTHRKIQRLRKILGLCSNCFMAYTEQVWHGKTKIWVVRLRSFTWTSPAMLVKKPVLLIQALPFSWNWHWKDMGHLNTLKFAQTIFTQLTKNIFELHQISMPIQICSCQNYFQWGVWITWNMDFFPIGVYGRCGMSEWLWKCTKSSDRFNQLS